MRCISGQGLTIIFSLDIKIFIKRKGRGHIRWPVCIMRPEYKRRLVSPAEGAETVFNAGDDRLRQPVDIILPYPFHRLAQCKHQSDVWILLYKSSDRLPGIIGNHRDDMTVAVLGL